LSLVMLSSIPPVVASAAVMSLVLSKLSNRSQMAYAEAGKVVEQTIGSIRTVISLFQKPFSIYFCPQLIFQFPL
jgi:ATP-binding cassette subfamily B (MDR/TAP) protein 1